MGSERSIPDRIAAVQARVDIVAVVGGAVKLSHASRPRGRCPFHDSSSDSFAVYPDGQRARCWGCGWSGDAISFLRDHYGLTFIQALEQLEGDLGLGPGGGRPLDAGGGAAVRREKVERRWSGPRTVDSAVVARHLWAAAKPDPDSLRVWLRARRVPEAMLGDHWFGQLRFCPSGPISAWPEGRDASAVHHAPAMVGLMRRVSIVSGQDGFDTNGDEVRELVACGVHATFLSPGLRAKLNRKRADGKAVPARKMFGASSGGFVVLGQYRRDCPLFVGEGIETVLSGMALAQAGEDACGLAVLSLRNLQGEARRWKGDVLPLFDIRPDAGSACVAFAHDGPVTGLIDADMKPLAGWRDPQTGEMRPPAVIERRGGPVVRRAISSAERSAICATLFTQRWRAAGCRRVRTVRPPMGMDFNDAARELV